jgi:protein-tyrosine-phosphatase
MNVMGNLLKKMQSAGVDMAGGSSPDEETKQRLREMGVEVYRKGGKVKMSTASKRADGIAQRGKTKGRMV